MMKRFISLIVAGIFILATLPVVAPAPARAWTHGTSASCPYATDNGCAAANPNGSFQNAGLLTSATQSGQNSLLYLHPMTFNIPAVDYPIGPDKTLTPQDPRNITTGNSGGACAWDGTEVGCSGSGVLTGVLNNYDFCGSKIGKAAVSVYAGGTPSAGSSLTITNSYFCLQASGGGQLSWGGGGGNNWSFVYKNNQCDGTSATSSSDYCLRDDVDAVGTSVDVEYSAFTNQNVPRVSTGLTNATWKFRYNFVQGLNDISTAIHGEIMLRNCTGARANCTSTEDDTGNFIVWNRIAVHSQNNATFFPSDGASDGLTLGFVNFVNNVVVTNLAADGIASVGNGLFGQRASTLGNVTITGNWLDASGSGDCGISGAVSGGNTVGAQQTGTVLNVTSLSGSFGNNPIEPGWQAFHSAYTTSSITSFGTASGNTGTYNMSGSSQSAGPDSNWTLVPGFTSQTLTGNMLLNDPSHTGSPTAIGYTGPQMAATNCF